MKFLFASALMLFTALSALAQHTLSGIITDKNDNAVLLEGVTIYIPQHHRLDVSKEGGTYILRGIGSGVVTVEFSRKGFHSVIKTIDLKDSATVMNVEMEMDKGDAGRIVQSGRDSRLSTDVPNPRKSFSATELNRKGFTTHLNALSYQPGIDVMSFGNNVNKPVVRGLSANRVLVYQGAMRLENNNWSPFNDLSVNENGVDNVELVKGAGSLMYGPGSYGGVLIFNDEKPAVAGTVSGDVDLGVFTNTVGLQLNTGVKGASESGFFYNIRFGGQSHTSYIQGNGDEVRKNTEERDFAFNSKYLNSNAKVTLGVSKKWGVSKLNFSMLRQSMGYLVPAPEELSLEENEKQRERSIDAPNQDVNTQLFSFENTILAGRSTIDANIGFQQYQRDDLALVNSEGQKFSENKLNTITYDIRFTSDRSKKFGYVIGSQSYLQTNRSEVIGVLTNGANNALYIAPDADINNLGAYAIFRYDTKKVNVTAGGRMDLHSISLVDLSRDYDFSLASGSAGIAYHPVERLTLKLNVSSGANAPNIAQLATVFGWPDRLEEGRNDLEAERNLQGDISLQWNHPDVTFSVEPYYNFINRFIHLQYAGKTVVISDTLDRFVYFQRNAVISGADVGLSLHPRSLNWISLNTTFGMVNGEFENGGNISSIPAGKVTGELRLSKKKLDYLYRPFISIGCRQYFMQDNVADYELAADAFTLLDFSFGGSFKWGQNYWDLTVAATNILNTGYSNALSLQRYYRPTAVRDIGRNIMVRIRVPFTVKKQVK